MAFKNALFLLLLFLFNFSVFPGETKRVIILETMPVKTILEHTKYFKKELIILCEKKGYNLDLEIMNAEGDREKAKQLLTEAINRQKPNLVVTVATLASQEGRKLLKDTDIPQLFFTVSDPVGAGLIEKINEPTGSNITGRIYALHRSIKINMVNRILKNENHLNIGYIHSTYPSSLGDLRLLREETDERLTFISYEIKYKEVPQGTKEMLEDVKKGIRELEDKIDFWWAPSGALGEIPEYSKTLINYSKKNIVLGNNLEAVKQGALLHLSADIKKSGYETATLACTIMEGTDPGIIPVKAPEAFILGLNLTTALELGLVIPPDIMELAGENIYR